MTKSEIKKTIVGDRILATNRCLETGVFTTEAWYNRNRELDRVSGPARITRDPRTGNVHKEWFQNGTPYRADGKPDKIFEDQHGNVITAVHTQTEHTVNAA